jgi:type II secretory pathway component PulF
MPRIAGLKHAVKNLSTALEPAMLIIVGSLVGFVVFAIITPIYDITGSIQ